MLLELPKDKKQEKIWTFKTIVCITQTGFAQWVTIGTYNVQHIIIKLPNDETCISTESISVQ